MQTLLWPPLELQHQAVDIFVKVETLYTCAVQGGNLGKGGKTLEMWLALLRN